GGNRECSVKRLVPDGGDQILGGGDRLATAVQELADVGVDGGVEVRLHHNGVHQPKLHGSHRRKTAAGQKELPCRRSSNFCENERRDHRGQNAEFHFGKAEHRSL